ncbi:hypothetical protein ACLOJK_011353 [Asimina triloba]
MEMDDQDLLSSLPQGCISHIIALTSPRDAGRSALVSEAFKSESASDVVWTRFLPPDWPDVVSRSVAPVEFSSKRELYFRLCDSILIDGGKMSFSVDKMTGKKCFMLSARELYIVWGDTPNYWKWNPHPRSREEHGGKERDEKKKKTGRIVGKQIWCELGDGVVELINNGFGLLSIDGMWGEGFEGGLVETLMARFAEVAMLDSVCWLEIHGLISSSMLSPKTTYTAYLVMGYNTGAYGIDYPPADVSVKLGNQVSEDTASLQSEENCGTRDQPWNVMNRLNRWRRTNAGNARAHGRIPQPRSDGWVEIELGECFHDEGDEGYMDMSLMEIKGGNWKSGIIIEGIEIRPKVSPVV